MIKMIISDLDGTLLTHHKEIIEKDKQAIRKAIDYGVDVGIASGRMDVEIKEVLDIIGYKGHRISQNGAYVYSNNGERLMGKIFSADIVRDVYQFLTEIDDIKVTLFSENQAIVQDESMLNAIDDARLFFPIIADPHILEKVNNGLEISKISLNAENETLKQVQKQLQPFTEQVDTFISDPHCLDIMPKHINKGNGVQAILDSLHIEPNEIACIGDSFNDISMFDLTPHSYVMPQAEDKVKQHASHEVRHVYEAIHDLFSQGLITNQHKVTD
ncbi:Cof-type HAD-IIB family hydrolase [Salinibacillus xinjiangensis]|uniref:Cof-type HAD-IIB family hydrolase n=1 Tax=Salinibacillus xinjiangensis TaxID=1229268 RepID=A0A6G1XAA1_9BACI|nr:Cof-type HAD-IIB family hydrolase [Salinibacillus xinjiangensis]MRG87933.1 Cof-type HAD-IIB family hydrolase [Salinibacillus xinjiangensis]